MAYANFVLVIVVVEKLKIHFKEKKCLLLP